MDASQATSFAVHVSEVENMKSVNVHENTATITLDPAFASDCTVIFS